MTVMAKFSCLHLRLTKVSKLFAISAASAIIPSPRSEYSAIIKMPICDSKVLISPKIVWFIFIPVLEAPR